MTRPSPSSANVVPTITERNAQAPAPFPDTVPSRSIASISSHCTNVMTTAMGMRSTPRPRKRPGRLTYILAEAAMIWPHDRRRAIRSGATGVQVARTAAKITRPSNVPRTTRSGTRVDEELRERPRALRDRRAEEVRRPGAEGSSRRHRVASIAPVLGPRDRQGPLRLQVRACRPVVEGLLQLAPAPFEGDPRIGLLLRPPSHSGSSRRAGRARGAGRACRRSRRLPRPSSRARARPSTCWRGSPPPDRRRGARPTTSSFSSSQVARSAPSCELYPTSTGSVASAARASARRRRAGSSPSRPRACC